MDDELPTKMTHNELVDLHMRLKILKHRAIDARYYALLFNDEIESLLQMIDGKIISELS